MSEIAEQILPNDDDKIKQLARQLVNTHESDIDAVIELVKQIGSPILELPKCLEKLYQCDWERVSSNGETIASEMIYYLQYNLLNFPKCLEKLLQCDWNKSITHAWYINRSLADVIVFSMWDRILESPQCLEKLLQCDWEQKLWVFNHCTLAWQLTLTSKTRDFIVEHPKFLSKLLSCNWNVRESDPNSYFYGRTIASHLVEDKASFLKIINNPEAQTKFLQSDWECTSHKIPHLLIAYSTHRSWVERTPEAQRKLAECDWLTPQKVYGEHENLLSVFLNDRDANHLLLQSKPLMSKLYSLDWNLMMPYQGCELPLGDIVTQFSRFIVNPEIVRQATNQIKMNHQLVFAQTLWSSRTASDSITQVYKSFSTYLALIQTQNVVYPDLKKCLFKALIKTNFPKVKDHHLIEKAYQAWQTWDKANAPAQTKLATLLVYRNRQQEGVLWNATRAEERGMIEKLSTRLKNGEPYSRSFEPFVRLKVSLSETINKTLSKQYQWREVDEKSLKFFTPFHGERAKTLAKALQATKNVTEMKQILKNQLDIYDNPKSRASLPTTTDPDVAKRLQANFKRFRLKGIRGYYALLNHLMKTVESDGLTRRSRPAVAL